MVSPGATSSPLGALARLVSHENTASDLLALLIELDPGPLRTILGLDGTGYHVRREVPAGGGGRLDLVDRNLGLLETRGCKRSADRPVSA